MWWVKLTVFTVVIKALGAVTPKRGEWLQQIPATTSVISVQKIAVVGTAKILRRSLKPGSLRVIRIGPELEGWTACRGKRGFYIYIYI